MPHRLFVRSFLNLPGHFGGAYIRAIVPDSSRPKRPRVHHSPVLEIADCNRNIDLDFDLYGASARRNSVRKAWFLADTLTRFAEALETEALLAAEDEKRQDRDRAAKRRRREQPITVRIETLGFAGHLSDDQVDRLQELLQSRPELEGAVLGGPRDFGPSLIATTDASTHAEALTRVTDAFREALAQAGIAATPAQAEIWTDAWAEADEAQR